MLYIREMKFQAALRLWHDAKIRPLSYTRMQLRALDEKHIKLYNIL